MKTLALVLSVFVLLAGAAPMALAQQDSSSQPAAPSAPSASPPAAPADKAPDTKGPDAKVETKSEDSKTSVDIKMGRDRSSDDAAGAASPRTEGQRTGFFGLSPTAAIIVSVAVLLVVVLAIVAMTQSGGTTYIDKGDRRL